MILDVMVRDILLDIEAVNYHNFRKIDKNSTNFLKIYPDCIQISYY
jgi:hypothetical protein